MTTKFRLKMATQRGEQIAKEHGFESLPVDPFAIAKAADIHVTAKRPDQKGVSGGIVFLDNSVGIFYATDIDNEGYQRFTVGHELGHYFLEGHPEEITRTSAMHVSRAGFTQGDSIIELEADHFAAGLLMPKRLVQNTLSNGTVGLDGILALAIKAKSSVTAAAIRAAQCSPYPIAIVVSAHGKVCYGFLSDGFKELGNCRFPRKGDRLPDGVSKTLSEDPTQVAAAHRECAETNFRDWFDGDKNIQLDEESIGLGNYGYTLTVFSSDDFPEEPDDDDGADEENVIESWTPKFARGR